MQLNPMRYRLRTLMIVLALSPMLIGEAVNLARAVIEVRGAARNMTCRNTLTVGVPGYLPPPQFATTTNHNTNAAWRSRP